MNSEAFVEFQMLTKFLKKNTFNNTINYYKLLFLFGKVMSLLPPTPPPVFHIFFFFFFFHLFLLVGGELLHNIAVGFVIH